MLYLIHHHNIHLYKYIIMDLNYFICNYILHLLILYYDIYIDNNKNDIYLIEYINIIHFIHHHNIHLYKYIIIDLNCFMF